MYEESRQLIRAYITSFADKIDALMTNTNSFLWFRWTPFRPRKACSKINDTKVLLQSLIILHFYKWSNNDDIFFILQMHCRVFVRPVVYFICIIRIRYSGAVCRWFISIIGIVGLSIKLISHVSMAHSVKGTALGKLWNHMKEHIIISFKLMLVLKLLATALFYSNAAPLFSFYQFRWGGVRIVKSDC